MSTGDWQLLYERYYRRRHLYDMAWPRPVQLSAASRLVFFEAASFGGPFAYLNLSGPKARPEMQIYTSSGILISSFSWKHANLLKMVFLEYVPGGSIASIIKRFGKFNENLVRVYTRQILYGLEYLHRHQIMHRDIKGANILVDTNGVCKLADFGAAARLADITQAQRRAIHGTPYWMAPEVIKQVGHGRQADIWSVGCTVIEMVTGKPPWHQFKTPVAALFHIAGTTSPPALPDDLSPSLRDFILSCMHRDPSKRPNAMRLLEHPYLKNGADPPSAATPSSPASAEGDAVADQARISDYLSARRASHLDSMRRSLVTRQGADDAPGPGDLSHDVAGDLAADSFSRSQSRRHSE
uniref:MAPKKK2 n=1 Tax=Plasmodiophora brassicae TaxID=37360 RepID=A0A2L2BMA9_PLABS|nr:MAPKKK2 [Plasmodiophora brassicae]